MTQTKDEKFKGIGETVYAFVDIIADTKFEGMTAEELRLKTERTNGSISGGLSKAQRAGLLVRLSERRDRHQVYVHPEYVKGRERADYKPNSAISLNATYNYNAEDVLKGAKALFESTGATKANGYDWNRLTPAKREPFIMSAKAVLESFRPNGYDRRNVSRYDHFLPEDKRK